MAAPPLAVLRDRKDEFIRALFLTRMHQRTMKQKSDDAWNPSVASIAKDANPLSTG